MKVQKLFHKCGHPILFIKKRVGPAEQVFFVDGDNPVVETKKGQKTPQVIERCPTCQGYIKIEKLLSQAPTVKEDDSKAPTGYIPARIK